MDSTEDGELAISVDGGSNWSIFNIDFPLIITGHLVVIGGELLSLDYSALLLAGVQSVSMWMIPVVIAGAGIGVFVIMRIRK